MKKYLIVGLGNYPSEYQKNRHNAGFMFLDYLNRGSFGINSETTDFILFKPQTMMNSSGKGIKRKLESLGLSTDKLIVIYDDISIPFGAIRYREKGSAGGHNGIKSIISELNTTEFKRIKIGIGFPESGEIIDYVLSDFTNNEIEKLNEIFKTVEKILREETK
jgi:PTH1 family peptidyl-tRNA hydrolase